MDMFGMMQSEIKLVAQGQGKLAYYDEALNIALKAINKVHGIMAASRETGLAYSNICERLNQWEEVTGKKLIERKCGIGSSITNYGMDMILCYEKEVMKHGTRNVTLPD